MCEFIYIKYGDLTLKGNNRNSFVNSLYENIKEALYGLKIKIIKNFDNLKIYCNSHDTNYIINILKYVPGILYVIKALEVNTDIEAIKMGSTKFINPNSTFKIEVKRKYKNFLEQIEIKKKVASYLLYMIPNLKVDVHNPNTCLWIEIKKDKSIIYAEKTLGIGGLPIGLNGSCLSLISGGIDSCVSSYLMQKKEMKVDYLTFVTSDVTDKTIKKIIGIINRIVLNGKIYKPKLYIIDFTAIQGELAHAKDINYRITLMRRSFYRIAQEIANLNNYDCLCSGDSLGQVASQTIESINVINNVLNDKIVFRPLLAFDKNQIINIAQQIHTYELSITNHEDICSMFAPKSPVTRPNIDKAIANEKELELLEIMENRAVNNVRVFK